MKAIVFALCGALLLGSFGLYPFRAANISDLQPVQVLTVQRIPFGVALQTDNGLKGLGYNYKEAMAHLRASAPGEAFFACCSAVVLCGGEELLPEVLKDESLRPAAAVYLAEGVPMADEIAPVLAAHPGDVRIADLQRDAWELPRLQAGPEGWRVEDGA